MWGTRFLLLVQKAGQVSMRDLLRGSQVSKARPGAPFGFTLRFGVLDIEEQRLMGLRPSFSSS
jgi:hypothetical protein